MVTLTRAATSPFAALVALGAVACSEPELAKADVEQSAMKTLSAAVGKPSPAITCPGNLKGKVGAKLTCSAPMDGKTYDVMITVTSIEGTTANFSVEVADKPRP